MRCDKDELRRRLQGAEIVDILEIGEDGINLEVMIHRVRYKFIFWHDADRSQCNWELEKVKKQ